MVGRGVYEAGFEALRRHLRQGGDRQPRAVAAGAARAGEMTGQAVVLKAFGGTGQLSFENVAVPAPGPREVRLRQAAAGVNYIDVSYRQGRVPPDRAASAARHGGGRHGDRCRIRGARHPARRPRGLCPWQAGRLCRLADPAGRSGRSGSFRHRYGDRCGAAVQGHDGGVPVTSHPYCAGRRDDPGPCRRRRRWHFSLPVGQASRRPSHRHGEFRQ